MAVNADIEKVKRGFIKEVADRLVCDAYSTSQSTKFQRAHLEGEVNKYHAKICSLMSNFAPRVRIVSGEIRVVCEKSINAVWRYFSSYDVPNADSQQVYKFACQMIAEKEAIEKEVASLKGEEKMRLMHQAKEKIQVCLEEKIKQEHLESGWWRLMMEAVFEKLVSQYGELKTAELH